MPLYSAEFACRYGLGKPRRKRGIMLRYLSSVEELETQPALTCR